MQEPVRSETSVDVFVSRVFLAAMTLGFLCSALLVAMDVAGLLQGKVSVIGLVLHLFMVGCSGWMSYRMWHVPVLHLDPSEIRLHPGAGLSPQRIPVADVTGFRWPYPSDLWIERRGGSTLRLGMIGISRRDRERVREWLSDRWVDGGPVS
jgi:hypothetical protein